MGKYVGIKLVWCILTINILHIIQNWLYSLSSETLFDFFHIAKSRPVNTYMIDDCREQGYKIVYNLRYTPRNIHTDDAHAH